MISNDNFNNTPNSGNDHAFESGYANLTPILLLQSVRVASPCNAVWEDMQAVEGERVHFCMGCQKNVYNLSAMSQYEAEGLLRRHEGRLCVRYYQRHDGTVLTGDCPIGAQMVRMGLMRRSAMAAGLFAMLFGAMAAMNQMQQQTPVPTPPIAGGVSVAPSPEPVAPPVVQDTIPAPDPKSRPLMGRMRMPERPVMMGAVAWIPTHDPVKPTPEPESLPDTPPDSVDVPSEPDTTDAALLKPH